jgi:DNA-binding response OmpR family regulator
MKVLVVDDNEDIRLLLRQVLDLGGFEVTEAENGNAALESLAGEQLPAAVILDVQMPDIDGWEVLALIRANPATQELPVLLCTVKGRLVDAEKGWEFGCDGYVTKPFDVDEILAEMRAVTSRNVEERAAVRVAALEMTREMVRLQSR